MPPPEQRTGNPAGEKMLVVFCGMTASGKSTLGQAWAARCRASYYNTDRVRKQLAGLDASDKRPDGVGQGIYTAALTEETYRTMYEHAGADFSRDVAQVVLDGSFGRRSERDRVRSVAAEAGARCVFIFCTCAEAEVRRRLAHRAQDPEAVSDGRWEIYLYQRHTFEPPDALLEPDCLWLNTQQPVETLLQGLASRLGRQD